MIVKDPSEVQHRIHKLTPEVANQIAAGEVIERPASVLKELLENSLDANSTEINVTIEQGGIKLIKIQDNGFGILKEDLELALTQHATSKIRTVNELECLASFGFRGEALASIASVSKLRLSSCTENQETGYTIEKEGRTNSFKISASPRILGTTIEIRDLFYNTPARRQFLRSEKTESNYIEQMFKRIVLGRKEVSFSFKSSDRNQKYYKNCINFDSYVRRVREICGNNFIDHANYIEAESNGLVLKGWLGSLKQLRPDPELQYFYVNGRIIRDKLINHAIRQSFQEHVTVGRYPSYLLFLEIDPKTVDVNVHPTKHEVRFRDSRTMYAFISYSLQESLKQTSQMQFELISNQDNKKTLKDESSTYIQNIQNYIDNTKNVPKDLNNIFGKPLAIVGNELLLSENEESLTVVDIPILYNFILKNELNNNLKVKNPIAKPLLMPVVVPMPKLYKFPDITEQYLNQLGFRWSDFSEESILLREIPSILNKVPESLNVLFEKMIKISDLNELIDCVASHAANVQRYSFEEAKEILDEFQTKYQNNNPQILTHCYRKITLNELKRILF